MLINKKERTCCQVDFVVPVDHAAKMKENEKTQVLGPCQRTKISMKYESGRDTIYDWCAWNSPQRLDKENGKVGNQRTKQKHPNYCFVTIKQKSEKIPGDLSGLAITQTPSNTSVKKLSRSIIIIIIIIIMRRRRRRRRTRTNYNHKKRYGKHDRR